MASTPATSPPDPLLGTTVGSFRLVRRIGHGGMGSVYLGEQTLIGSKVAVKVLHEHLASDASLVQRFYAEARAVNLIGHPNIVNIFDMNVVPPRRYYLIMEYLEGEPLSAAPAGPMPPEQALPILIQVCQALQAAHARGVVHRDLKPENIFLCRRDGPPFVKILDFGIAKLFGGEMQEGQTHAGSIVGTPEYMAPEQGDGDALDGRADIYALGVIAYRLATGRLPFTGGGVTGVLLAHRDTPPVPPRELNPRVSEAWSGAILGALAKRREARFPDADSFRAALERALARTAASSAPVPARGGRTVRRSSPRVPTPHVTHAPAPSSPAPAPATFRGTLLIDGASRAVDLRDLSRAGVYACVPEPLPALFTRVQVSLEVPVGVLTPAEVVRQVPELQARAWGFAAGVALQFLEPPPPFREAVSRRLRGLPPLPSSGDGDPAVERLLTRARAPPPRTRTRAWGSRRTPSSTTSAPAGASCGPSWRASRPGAPTPASRTRRGGSWRSSTMRWSASPRRRDGWRSTPSRGTSAAWPGASPPASPSPCSRSTGRASSAGTPEPTRRPTSRQPPGGASSRADSVARRSTPTSARWSWTR